MTYRLSESPSGRARRWVRRKDRAAVPSYARPAIIILSVILLSTLAWQATQYALHMRHRASESPAAPPSAASVPGPSAWQREVGAALDAAVRNASDTDVSQTEVAIDRATSLLTVARVQGKPVQPDFYDAAVAQLDQILAAYHDNSRVIEHVTLARIELAQLRSSQESLPAGTPSLARPEDLLLPRTAPTEAKPQPAPGSASKPEPGHVLVGAPRTLGANTTLDAGALGGNFLDATIMPSSAEILEPPSSRLAADDVRVENLSIAGATQTLDGIHWKNITFIGTRLRYEGGEVDLHNVRFIHCMFGFTPDRRGGEIANAIAQGQTTIVIE